MKPLQVNLFELAGLILTSTDKAVESTTIDSKIAKRARRRDMFIVAVTKIKRLNLMRKKGLRIYGAMVTRHLSPFSNEAQQHVKK